MQEKGVDLIKSMIYTCLKYQSETSWTINIYLENEGQVGKIGLCWRWVQVGSRWVQGEG
jgi:hypothetical protein